LSTILLLSVLLRFCVLADLYLVCLLSGCCIYLMYRIG
jgi:hypothetical protein